MPVYITTNGKPIRFRVVDEIDATTAPGPYLVRFYTDSPVATLRGRVADFHYEWLEGLQPEQSSGRGGSYQPTPGDGPG